jgi:hypothetical protein
MASTPIDPNGFPVISPGFLIPRGTYPELDSINKFGHNPDSASGVQAEIWDGSAAYSYPTTADITHIRQDVNDATMAGETVEVQGLDENWDLVTQEVDLDGTDTTTPTALTTPMIRVFRAKVHADVVAAQDIQVINSGATTVYAIIAAGNNQTLMAIYTVPRDYQAYMTGYYGSHSPVVGQNPTSIDFKLWAADRKNQYEFQIKHHFGVPVGGRFQHKFDPYKKFGEKTDIRLTGTTVGSDANLEGGFDLILIQCDG